MSRASWFAALTATGAVIAVSTAAVLALPSAHPAQQRARTAGNGGPVVPLSTTALSARHPLLGVATSKGLVSFDREVGARMELYVRYVQWWTLPSRYELDGYVRQRADIMLVLLPNHTTIQAIAAGKDDGYLKKLAFQIRHVPCRFIISFAPEMNGGWYPWGYRNALARQYVAAFRHVHDVIWRSGTHNVWWMWQLARAVGGTFQPLEALWPGKSFVDVVGLDGYYHTAAFDFKRTFGGTLGQVRGFAKTTPVMIAETSVARLSPAERAAKIRDMFNGMKNSHFVGLIWFDNLKGRGLSASPPELRVFRYYVQRYLP